MKTPSIHYRYLLYLLCPIILLLTDHRVNAQDIEVKLGGDKVRLKKKSNTYAVSYSSQDTSVIHNLRKEGLNQDYKTSIGAKLYAVYSTQDYNKLKGIVNEFNASSSNDAATIPVYEYGNSLNILKNEFIVKFKDDINEGTISKFFQSNRISIISRNKYFKNQYVITFVGMNPQRALRNLPVNNPIIDFIEPNLIQIIKTRPSSIKIGRKQAQVLRENAPHLPDDNYLGNQWYLSNAGVPHGTPHADVKALEGWQLSTGEDVIIAIIDEGVDTRHPDLKGKIVTPFDAVESDDDQQPQNHAGHGTSCAGIAAAVTNNGLGISGIGWNSKIMPVRIAKVNSNDQWETNAEIIANGMMEAINRGAKVLSCSWGGGTPSSSINNAIAYALKNERVVVFAAGNDDSTVNYPASLSKKINIITVAATNEWDESKSKVSRDGEDWWGTNFGDEITISAPGVHMVTTDISGEGNGYDPYSDYVFDFNGTSSATPLVSGTIALILSINGSLTVPEIIKILKEHSDDLGAVGFDPRFGYGRINALKLLEAAKSLKENH